MNDKAEKKMIRAALADPLASSIELIAGQVHEFKYPDFTKRISVVEVTNTHAILHYEGALQPITLPKWRAQSLLALITRDWTLYGINPTRKKIHELRKKSPYRKSTEL